MSKGIFILLPDDLFEKIEKLKDSIDISEVCSRALQKEIDKMEKQQKQEIPMERGRIEIKVETEDYIRLWKARGFEDGIRDAETFNYRAFMEILNVYKSLESVPDRFSPDEMIPGEIYDSILHPRLKDLEDTSPERRNYLIGWIEGVVRKWNMVKDRFE